MAAAVDRWLWGVLDGKQAGANNSGPEEGVVERRLKRFTLLRKAGPPIFFSPLAISHRGQHMNHLIAKGSRV